MGEKQLVVCENKTANCGPCHHGTKHESHSTLPVIAGDVTCTKELYCSTIDSYSRCVPAK